VNTLLDRRQAQPHQHIAEFTDISGPTARRKARDVFIRYREARIDGRKKVAHDRIEIRAVRQRRQRHIDGIQTIKKIGPEPALGDRTIELGIGRRDKQDIDNVV
jgi:hypothetical protein